MPCKKLDFNYLHLYISAVFPQSFRIFSDELEIASFNTEHKF